MLPSTFIFPIIATELLLKGGWMKTLCLFLILCTLAFASEYDQLHVDLGVWTPSLSGINDYLKNQSGWNTEYPTTGPLITVGYRHRWESFFALGADLAFWTTSTSVTDQPIDDLIYGTWYLTGKTSLNELWITILPQFCIGNNAGFEAYIAPEISLVNISLTARLEGAPTPLSEAIYKDWGEIEGSGGGIGIQTGFTWSLSQSLELGGTIRYATNDWKTNFDQPRDDKVWFGMKGLSISPRLAINL
jgi:hypothetical protein